jgi:predicted RNA-binding protein Jag
VRAWELAQQIGLTFADLRDALQSGSLSFELKSHLTQLSSAQVSEIMQLLGGAPAPAAASPAPVAAPAPAPAPTAAPAPAPAARATRPAKGGKPAPVVFPDPANDSSDRQFKRTWEVAKLFNIGSPELRELFVKYEIPVDVSTHMKWISEAQCEAINARLEQVGVETRIPTGDSGRVLRVYEVAAELNLDINDFRTQVDAAKLGIDVSTHMKRLSAADVERIRKVVKPGSPAPAASVDEDRVRMFEVATRSGLEFAVFKAAVNATAAAGLQVTSHLQYATESQVTRILGAIKGFKPAPVPVEPKRPRGRPRKERPIEVTPEPPRTRVYELATELGMRATELIAAMKAAGSTLVLSSHLQKLSDAEVATIRAALKPAAGKAAKASAKSTPAPAAAPAATKPAAEAKAAPAKPAAEAKAAPAKPAPEAKAAPAKPAAEAKAAPAKPAPEAKAEPAAAPPAAEAKPAPPARPAAEAKPAKSEPAPVNPGLGIGTQYLSQVLPAMGAARPRIQVVEKGDVLEFEISGFDPSVVLGKTNAAARTDVVESLETLTAKAIQSQSGNVVQVRIDVGGFRKGRPEDVAAAASRLARFVVESNLAVSFAVMSAFDRFAFHSELKAAEDVRSESEGMGVQRRLGVRPARRNQQG